MSSVYLWLVIRGSRPIPTPGPVPPPPRPLWFLTTKNIFLSCRNIKRILIWYLVKDKISVWFQWLVWWLYADLATFCDRLAGWWLANGRSERNQNIQAPGSLVSDYNNDGMILSSLLLTTAPARLQPRGLQHSPTTRYSNISRSHNWSWFRQPFFRLLQV